MSNEDSYSKVTSIIIKAIESGDFFEFDRPWIPTIALPLNYMNKGYAPLNSMLLGYSAKQNKFEGRNWLTANRIGILEGYVDKEKETATTVYSTVIQWVTPDGTFYKGRRRSKEDKKIFLYLQTGLYNVDQCDWGEFPIEYDHLPPPKNEEIEKSSEFRAIHAHLDPYLGRYKIPVEYDTHDGAAYSPTSDKIYMPSIASFKNEQGYASVLCHETIHSTGHKSRLKRDLKGNYDKESYSLEELVAELGAAMTLAQLGIVAPEHNKQSIAYITGWLKVFKGNNRILSIADAQARKAIALIERQSAVAKIKKEDNPQKKMKDIIKEVFKRADYGWRSGK
jgi:antirestriction protein ArdC